MALIGTDRLIKLQNFYYRVKVFGIWLIQHYRGSVVLLLIGNQLYVNPIVKKSSGLKKFS